MLELEIPIDIIEKARQRASAQSVNKFTISSDGRLYGFIAEEIFLSLFGGVLKNTKHYDIELNGKKIDIKAKSCNTPPKMDYIASISNYQKDHDADIYVFFRIDRNLTKCWLLGGLSKEEFYKISTFMPKGERDGSFVCKTDMNNVLISQLKEVNEILRS